MKEILKLKPSEGQDIIWGDDPNFKEIENKIIDRSRWCIHYRIIVQRKSDQKFFESYYRQGATESQDERPYECDDFAKFTEVKPVEKTVIVYE
jgi:hypothetical protein